LKNKVTDFELQINTELIPNQGVFFNGQVFDAYSLTSKIIRSAKQSIVLIDNYIDESTLTLLSKKRKEVQVLLLTKTVSKQLSLDLQKAQEQPCCSRFVISNAYPGIFNPTYKPSLVLANRHFLN